MGFSIHLRNKITEILDNFVSYTPNGGCGEWALWSTMILTKCTNAPVSIQTATGGAKPGQALEKRILGFGNKLTY